MHKRVAVSVLACLSAGTAFGQEIAPEFAADYSFIDLGPPPGVPIRLGGLTLLAGTTDVLLVGGAANGLTGALYAITLTRDADGHITGFAGPAVYWGEALYNDGGVAYGPGGVLFVSRWPSNELAQYAVGSNVPGEITQLAQFGSAHSNAAVNMVPSTHPGSGRLKVSSWPGGEFYDVAITPNGSGTFTINSLSHVTSLPCGPEGFAYVKTGSPQIISPSMIVSEYSCGTVSLFDTDVQGNPVIATRRVFMTGLGGAEGAFVDPRSGDFLFSTFGGGDRIVVVRGFAGEPPTCDPDYDQNGVADQDDVSYLINVIGGGDNPTGRDPDFDCNGVGDQDDISALINVVAGGDCPC